ncbi:MAG: hypothetical protein AAI946_00565 [Candidatus Hodgkinia cicadicola]
MVRVALLYVLCVGAFHIGDVELLSLKLWAKGLVVLDRIASCDLMCAAELVFVSKHWYLRRCCCCVNTASACYYVLPN